ncbi:MAG: hypothetical protein WC581_03645 [Thermodesulfovibrionales bacterium]
MPIYNGSYIPFDADRIAEIILNGEEVQPDPFAPLISQRTRIEEAIRQRKSSISRFSESKALLHLRQLWRNA